MNHAVAHAGMFRRLLLPCGLVAACTLSLGALAWQHRATATLRTALERARKHAQSLPALQREHAELLAARSRPDAPGSASAAPAVKAELARLRQAIADEERLRNYRPVARPSAAPAVDPLADHRDPTHHAVRLQHFRDVGRATPSAAFQTLIWALTTENDDAVTSLFALSPASRERMEALLQKLDPAAQARFRPPEKIVGQLISLDLLKTDAYRIAGETAVSAEEVRLIVHRWKNGREEPRGKPLPFVRHPDGWRIAVPDDTLARLPDMLAEFTLLVPSPYDR